MKFAESLALALFGNVAADSSDKPAKKMSIDYKQVFVDNPIMQVSDKVEVEKLEEMTNKKLVLANKQWSDRHTGKELTKKMLSIPNTMPFTPHGTMRYVDDSPYCWVIFAYDSDEDVESEIYPVAVDVAEYFYERCGVGLLDMAYPSNKASFGYLIEDLPMLLVKHSGRDKHILQKHLERGSFVMEDISKWGTRVLTDDLEDDIQGVMSKIIDEYYENGYMKDFTKVSSIYMQWYAAQSEEKRKGAKIIHEHVVEISKQLEDENGKLIKSKFYEEVYKTDEIIKEKLAAEGMRTAPREIVNNFGDEFKAEKTSYSDEL